MSEHQIQHQIQHQIPMPEREQAIARLLSCRFGDGGIYLPRRAQQTDTFEDAIADGFVSNDGFITRKGRRLLAQYSP